MLESIYETLMIFPFLFLSYLVMEYIEHKEQNSFKHFIEKAGVYGPIVGAVVGIIPQCGFSVIASSLYLNHKITLGTLLAVFISTSDEAVPILISYPHQYSSLIAIIVIKIIVGIIVGYIVDMCMPKLHAQSNDMIHNCQCEEHHSIVKNAFLHTMKILIFIMVMNMILSLLVESIGVENLSQFLGKGKVFQPFLSALFGFIPHCVASVILSELYVEGVLTFASLCAGLMPSSGLGLLVLFQMQKNKIDTFQIMGLLYGVSVICGLVLSILSVL